MQIECRSLNGRKSSLQNQLDDLSRKFINLDKNSPAYSINERNLCSLQNEIIDLELKVKQITDKLTNSSKIKLTKEEFLNLANYAYNKMIAGSPVEKDMILRKSCLNIYINDERTLFFIWKESFATLIKSRKINFGADERT